ncbi:MAG: GNAT family N-acetyltransferase [Pseudomonadales bacterium]|nr:GNAT family N-acetyltransferase [Pseudomonadales bacterium]
MNVSIEAATAKDAEAIANIHFESLREGYAGKLPQEYLDMPVTDWRINAWKKWIARSKVRTLVAKEDDQNVGFCTLQPFNENPPNKETAEIVALFVQPDKWRHGVGVILCKGIESEAKAAGFSKLALWVLESNENARNFYKAQGYQLQTGDRIFLETANEPLLEVMYRKSLVQ